MSTISELAAIHVAFWHRVNAFVYRVPRSFNAQVQQNAFWWGFSEECQTLLAAQRTEREQAAAAAERARMDEVHESRAQRHETKAAQS